MDLLDRIISCKKVNYKGSDRCKFCGREKSLDKEWYECFLKVGREPIYLCKNCGALWMLKQ